MESRAPDLGLCFRLKTDMPSGKCKMAGFQEQIGEQVQTQRPQLSQQSTSPGEAQSPLFPRAADVTH